MNYETFSNAELNQSLACLVYELDGWELSDSGGSFYHCGVDGGATYVQSVPDYCTDISATWPLMIERGVALIPTGKFTVWCAIHKPDIDSNNQIHANILEYEANPLRAIVICLIKVMESNQ